MFFMDKGPCQALLCLAPVQRSRWRAFQNRALPLHRLRTKKKTLDCMGFWGDGPKGGVHILCLFTIYLASHGEFSSSTTARVFHQRARLAGLSSGGDEVLVHSL